MLWSATRPGADGDRTGRSVGQWEADKPWIKFAVFEALEDALQRQPLALGADIETQ
jgi:hypothetical protein